MIMLVLNIAVFVILTIVTILMIIKLHSYSRHLTDLLEKTNMVREDISKKRKNKDNMLDISNSTNETNSTELQDISSRYFNNRLSEIDDLIHTFNKKGLSENDIISLVVTKLTATEKIQVDGLDENIINTIERDSYFRLLIKNRIKRLSGAHKKVGRDIKKEFMSSSLNIDLDQNIVTSNTKDETHMVNLFDRDLSSFDNVQYDKD